MQKGEKEEQES